MGCQKGFCNDEIFGFLHSSVVESFDQLGRRGKTKGDSEIGISGVSSCAFPGLNGFLLLQVPSPLALRLDCSAPENRQEL